VVVQGVVVETAEVEDVEQEVLVVAEEVEEVLEAEAAEDEEEAPGIGKDFPPSG